MTHDPTLPADAPGRQEAAEAVSPLYPGATNVVPLYSTPSEDNAPAKQSITDLAPEERPREKLLEKGPEVLTAAELLAILIGSGNTEENAVALMQRILTDHGNSLINLSRLDVKQFCTYKGIGEAKAITLIAACELGRRRLKEGEDLQAPFRKAEEIYAYLRPHALGKMVEESRVLLLNNSLRLIGDKLISRGGITGTVVDVRLVLREALMAGAPVIVFCHNHPSGSLRPSREDDNLTQRLKEAAKTVDIRLIDHLIITEGGYYSYQEAGRL